MLNFYKGSEGYGAIAGHWPAQWRFVIYRSGPEWRLSQRRHVAGKGFVEITNTGHRTLAKRQGRGERGGVS